MQIAYKILFLKFTVFGIHKKKLIASFWKIPLSEYNTNNRNLAELVIFTGTVLLASGKV